MLILNTIREFAGQKTHVGETFPLRALGIAFANFQVTELVGVRRKKSGGKPHSKKRAYLPGKYNSKGAKRSQQDFENLHA